METELERKVRECDEWIEQCTDWCSEGGRNELEAENAALWTFVGAQRDYNAAVQEHANEGGDDFFLTWRSNINVVKAQESLIEAEAALAQYAEGSSS
jgi:hypothetical protein